MSENFPKIIFVTGIGTDVGKSWATGWLAREIADAGHSVITHKFIQTGCHEFSEDIDTHRRIMGIAMQPRDLDHTTAPLILSYPASPQLSASIDGVTVDYDITIKAIHQLSEEYDTVISEGAGGLMVPRPASRTSRVLRRSSGERLSRLHKPRPAHPRGTPPRRSKGLGCNL